MGQSVVIGPSGGTVGRAPTSTWVLLDAEKLLSRSHLKVSVAAGQYFVEDTSANGVFLNGAQLPLGQGAHAPIKSGDVIRIGNYHISISAAASPSIESKPVVAQDLGCVDFLKHPTAAPSTQEPADFIDELLSGNSLNVQTEPSRNLGEPVLGGGEISSNTIDPLAFFDSSSSYSKSLSARDSLSGYVGSSSQPSSPSVIPSSSALQESVAFPSGNLIPDDWDILTPTTPTPQEQFEVPQRVDPRNSEHPKIAAKPQPHVVSVDDSGMVEELRSILGKTFGRDVQQLETSALLDLVAQMTATLDTVTSGVMKACQARNQVKNGLRMGVTIIQAADNNPLKMCPNVEDALDRLFMRPKSGYLASKSAYEDAMNDLIGHQLALIGAIEPAFMSSFELLAPARIESYAEAEGKKRSVLSTMKLRLWDFYKESYEKFQQPGPKNVLTHFWENFAKHYEYLDTRKENPDESKNTAQH
jgi:type VI secretion system FHA domain protein